MTAKATYRNGRHPSRDGGWVQCDDLDKATIEQIGRAVGYQLQPDHVARIQGFIETFKGLNDAEVPISHQEVVVTLQAIAKEPDERVQEAFDNCDEHTHCMIVRALYRMGERTFRVPFPLAKVKAAALLAHQELPRGESGRPRADRRMMFLRAVLSLWRDLTGTEGKAWTDGSGAASPMLVFAALLLRYVEPGWKPGDLEEQDLSALAKQLRKVNA